MTVLATSGWAILGSLATLPTGYEGIDIVTTWLPALVSPHTISFASSFRVGQRPVIPFCLSLSANRAILLAIRANSVSGTKGDTVGT